MELMHQNAIHPGKLASIYKRFQTMYHLLDARDESERITAEMLKLDTQNF